MRFLSVAERELRAAARRRGLYWLRWLTAAAFLVLLLWLSWVFGLFQNRGAGREVFQAFSVVTFLYCLFVGATGTADCLSREKREGTLGLLFLTNLNSAEIVAGKLCSNALAAFYSLLAIFPVLALPVLIGGVTLGHFWRTVLALVNALFFAIAAGFVASAVSVRQFPAIALATGLSLVLGMALLGAAEAMRRFGFPASVTEVVASFCPLHTLFSANDSARIANQSRFWISLAAVAGLSWAWLALVAWRLRHTWRDRPKLARGWGRLGFGERSRERGRASRIALRRRFLEINPFFWLAGRQRISAPIFMLLTVVLVVITVTVTAPFFGKVIGAGAISPVIGHLFAWFWTGLAFHGLVLYYGATVASQRLAEDKQTGALELILSTPVTERLISRGLWLAYGRRMFFPVLVAVLVHGYFLWLCATAFMLGPPFGNLPPGLTPGQLLWAAFFDQPINGVRLEWTIGFMLRVAALALLVFGMAWVAAGWVSRWLGLRMKHPGFAPLATVTLVVVPPVLLFSFICYLCDEWNVDRMPERQFLPMMKWIAFSVGVGHCLLLSAWAAGRLRHDFRTTVTSRFQPPSLRRWWRPDPRALLRFAARATALAVALVLAVLLLYGYQNHQSRRRWAAFQQQVKQRGESLELSPLLPGPVATEQNFAQTPSFQGFLNRKLANPSANALVGKMAQHASVDPNIGPANNLLTPWTQQGFADFDAQLRWIAPKFKRSSTKDRTNSASAVWSGLQPLQADMANLATAAKQPFFQATTNRGADAVYQLNRELFAMEQLHFLFQLRACALLALERPDDAGEDVLTSLRLTQLARQSPDMKSSLRVQVLLARSLQPIWEGLADHRWNEPQLAAFQAELARFNLLSDHTNAIRRAVLAHLETWRIIPDAKTPMRSVPQGGGVYVRRDEWAWQPRSWWYDHCIQLYEAGRKAVDRVDVAAGRMTSDYNWNDLRGLPLDGVANQLFQQGAWWGTSPALVSFAQTAVNQAIIACALERYRLAHRAYPESLEQLLPANLANIPPDIIRGRPMTYQYIDKDNYILRGAGANGIIDQTKKTSDDWLWSFPSATNAAPGAVTK